MHELFFKRSALIALLLAIAINALANIIPFNGMTTGAISDLYPLSITPAGYVFAIWSLLYFGLLAFSAYSLNHKNHLPIGIYILFFASSLANGAWIVAWHYQMIIMSVVFMLLLLLSLIRINEFLLHIAPARSPREYAYVHIPFQMYLAWITIATTINIGVALYAFGWNGFGLSNDILTALVLVFLAVVSTATILRYVSIPFVCVVLWAGIGIAVKQEFGTLPYVTICGVLAWHVGLFGYLCMRYSTKQLLRMARHA